MSNAFGKTTVNENGGAQSELDTRFDLIPPCQLRNVAEVLAYGAEKYGRDNWKLISCEEHLNHVFQHINAHQLGLETGEPHLQHALVRMFFAAYMADKNPADFIGKVKNKKHVHVVTPPTKSMAEAMQESWDEEMTVGFIIGDDIETQEYFEYDPTTEHECTSVYDTSAETDENFKEIYRGIFGISEAPEPKEPEELGDFFGCGYDSDIEYPIIRTETPKPVPKVTLMLKGLGDK